MWDVDSFCFFYGLFTFLFDIGYLWIIFINQSDFSAIQFPKRSLVASSALLIATYGVFLVIHNFVFHMFHLHLFKIIKNHIPLHILFLSKQFNISVCRNDTLWDLGIKVYIKYLLIEKTKQLHFLYFSRFRILFSKPNNNSSKSRSKTFWKYWWFYLKYLNKCFVWYKCTEKSWFLLIVIIYKTTMD